MSPLVSEPPLTPVQNAAGLATGSLPDAPATTIVTRRNFATSPGQVWNVLMFYEEIEVRPPLLLRLLLPMPIRTEGSKRAVGDVATCLYEGGHLRKRVTHVEPGKYYGFEVVEQHLAVGNGLMLTGGCYALRELPSQATEVAVTTHYRSRRRPRWLWKPIEAAVCHLFHRHLLNAMWRKIASG